MIIKKPIALGFVICNAVYTVICIIRFIYTNSQVLIDINKPPPLDIPQNSIWYIVPQILYVIIFVGLVWLLKIFDEKFWMRLAVIAFIALKIATLLLIHFNDSQYLLDHNFVFDIVNVGNFITLLYLLVALLFVRNRLIRIYFRWFVILMILAFFAPRLGEILYDDFSIHWLLFNIDALSELCFIVTLLLFVKVYTIGKKNSGDSNMSYS